MLAIIQNTSTAALSSEKMLMSMVLILPAPATLALIGPLVSGPFHLTVQLMMNSIFTLLSVKISVLVPLQLVSLFTPMMVL